MMMCSHCKKNIAVIFVTRMENGKTINEGLCLPCAKELGIDVSKQMEAMGINAEDFDNIEEQMASLFGMPGGDMMEIGDDDDDNPMKSFFKLAGGSTDDEDDGKEKGKKPRKEKKRLLDSYGTNITKRAAEGNVDPVVGRDSEITRCIEVLNRRTKNNPCLIGEPGVGKTAIAEGLATRIVAGNVPEKLLNHEIYLLDFTSIVAGTQFRGQFEARLKKILEEVKKAGNIILVIDELHNIVAAGDADGAMSAANILKPSLARGEIQIIGATTTTEYRKFIEKDTALERRFQPIMVDEPSVDETIEIIKGLRPYYESYHKVTIPTEVIISAANLSERYITDRFLPDKAIDIIDEASSRANLNNTSRAKLGNISKEIEKLTGSIDELASSSDEGSYEKMADLKVQLCRLEGEKTQLTVTYNPADTTDSKAAKWSSSDTSVATVSEGAVVANSAGTAEIICTVGNCTAKITIVVKQEPNYVKSVSLSNSEITLTAGGTTTLIATPALAYPDRPEGVDTTAVWSSANGYVSVNGGAITARTDLTSETGTLTDTVTVTVGGRSASCVVVITDVTIPVVTTPQPTTEPAPEVESTPTPVEEPTQQAEFEE